MLDSKSPSKEEATRILHVDDDSLMLETAKLVLNDMDSNFVIDFACGTDDAFCKLSKKEYDVIISDYEMPVKDGLAFLRELKEKRMDVPFILFTGKGREEVAIEALNLGADHYVNKLGSPETVYGELCHGIHQCVQRRQSQKALLSSEETFRAYLESSPVPVFVADDNGKYEYVNSAATRLLGFSREELLNLKVHQLVPTSDNPGTRFNQLKEKGYFAEEMELKRKDNTSVRVILSANRLPDGKLVAFCQDVTERKKIEDTLIKNEQRYRELYDRSPVCYQSLDADGYFIEVNQAWLDKLGYSREEVVGHWFGDFLISTQVTTFKQLFLYFKSSGKIHSEFELKHKDGSIMSVAFEGRIGYDETGNFKQTHCIMQEITESKKAKQSVENKYEVLSRFADSIDSGLAIIGKDYRVIWANNILAKVGFRPNAKCYEVIKRKSVCPECGVRKVLEENALFDVHEYRTVNSNGKTTFLEIHATPLRDQNGDVTSAIELVIPITERKKAEEQLRQSQLILEHSSDSIIVTDLKGNITSWNKGAENIFGYCAKEIIGQPITKIVKPQERLEVAPKQLDDIRHGDMFVQAWEGVKKDGSAVWLILTTKLVENETGEPIAMVGFGKDITQFKKTQEALMLSEQRYRTFADSLPEIVFEFDDKGKPSFVNKKAIEILGYSYEEIMGMRFLDFIVPEERQIAQENVEKRIRGEKTRGNEYHILRKDNTIFPALVFSEVISNEGTFSLRGIILNLSELKEKEKQLAAVNEKLRVVGSLTRHDVANKLMAAKANLYLLKKKTKDDPELTKYISTIDETLNQSSRIFDFSGIYEKIGAEKLEPMMVDLTFAEAAKLTPHLGVEIISNTHGLTLIADSLLRQLFYNLIDNSLKHGKTTSKIKLSCTQRSKYTKLIYEDNGVGVPHEDKSRVFQDGFTTGGSGLGLKLVRKIAEVYGWTITEEGTPGEGAKFVITVPKK